MIRGITLTIILMVVILGGIYVKSWQCAELFPNANRFDCMMWKG